MANQGFSGKIELPTANGEQPDIFALRPVGRLAPNAYRQFRKKYIWILSFAESSECA
jgi:hypothetical protein